MRCVCSRIKKYHNIQVDFDVAINSFNININLPGKNLHKYFEDLLFKLASCNDYANCTCLKNHNYIFRYAKKSLDV